MRRGESYFAVDDRAGELIGLFVFKPVDQGTVGVGLGLRPDLTGIGLGESFVQAGLNYARSRFAPTRFVLSVATFNERAIKVYERAGFVEVRRYRSETNSGLWEFVQMERRAEPTS